MDINQIYARFETPLNLQKHMRGVAEVVKKIIEGWKESFTEKEEIILAALIHDLAKPVTFDPVKQSQYIKDKGELAKALNMIKILKEKYGQDEHKALRAMCREAGVADQVIKTVMKVEWKDLPDLLDKEDLLPLVIIYADMRVSPKGIVLLNERLDDLVRREPKKTEEIEDLRQMAERLEEKIQALTQTDLSALLTI